MILSLEISETSIRQFNHELYSAKGTYMVQSFYCDIQTVTSLLVPLQLDHDALDGVMRGSG